MRTISEAKCFRLEERIYLRLLAEQQIAEDSRRLLKKYVEELLRPDDSFSFITENDEHLKQKWGVLDEYFASPGLLTESKKVLIEGLFDSAWKGLKNLATVVGGKVIDDIAWINNNAKKYGAETIKILKKVGGKFHEMMIYAIKSLPGGEIVLEFLSKIAGSIQEKLKEMKAAIGKKVTDFINSAKEKILDLFFKHVLTDPDLKADFMAAMGLKEGKLSNISLLTEDLDAVTANLGLPNAEDSKKVVDALEGKGENPEVALRNAGANVIEKLIDFWLKLVVKNPEKYHKPFFKSKFFEPLGTGFGFAAAAILGILAASQLQWNDLVTYVKSIIRGFAGGLGKPEGAKTRYAAAYLFLGNESNGYDATLFKSFITGIIKGSNVEIIARAFLGDGSRLPDLAKSLLKTIINGIKEKIKEVSKQLLPQTLAAQGIDSISDKAEAELVSASEEFVDSLI